MAKWRDIPSVNDWATILNLYAEDIPGNRPGLIALLTIRINQYHKMEKTSLKTLDERILKLQVIAQYADSYLADSSAGLDTNPLSEQKRQSLTSWITYLKKQAHKKATYLQQIKEFSRKYPTQEALTEKLHKREAKRKSDSGLKLVGGTFLEREDPAHRDFEFPLAAIKTATNGSGSLANTLFFNYIHSLKTNSFFLSLEDQFITTATPGITKGWEDTYRRLKTVDYTLEDKVVVSISGEGRLIYFTNDNQNPVEALNTAKMKNLSYKIGSAFGSTAFVWSYEEPNQFITHPHRAGKYHHSSLFKGKKVRCAGMWLVKNGKVEQINNSSGHYQPSSLQFYQLIMFLSTKNLLAPDVRIADMRRPLQAADPNLPLGGTKSQYSSLEDYLAWAETLPEVVQYLHINKNSSPSQTAAKLNKTSPRKQPHADNQSNKVRRLHF